MDWAPATLLLTVFSKPDEQQDQPEETKNGGSAKSETFDLNWSRVAVSCHVSKDAPGETYRGRYNQHCTSNNAHKSLLTNQELTLRIS